MMNKFWFLTKNSFMKKAGSKWFLIVNIILCLAIVAVLNIDSIIKAFGGNFNDTYEIVLLDNTGNSSKIFEDNLNALNEQLSLEYKFDVTTTDKSRKEIEEEIKGTNKLLIVFNKNDETVIDAAVVSDSYIDTAYYQLVFQSLSSTKNQIAMDETSIDPVELAKLSAPISIDRVLLSEDKNSSEESTEMIMGTVFPTLILPIFMLVIFLVQMIGAEINEEKQTRSMEVIISNVSPKVHFFSKLLASNGFVIIQGLLLLVYAGIALLIKDSLSVESTSVITKEIGNVWNTLTTSGFVDKLVYIVPLTLVIMILSFITYSLVAGILASMTVNMEDFQHIQTPIMMVLLVGYYLAIMAGMFDGSILIRVFSYVPGISCLLSPALLVIGDIGVIDVVISIIVLVIFNGLLIKYGLRIYKVGILNYSTDKMWKKIFKAVKNK